MKLFIDSANLKEIKKVKDWGLLDGVTTNPSLIKKAAKDLTWVSIESYINQILKTAGSKKPVSLEVIGSSFEEMVAQGQTIYKKFNKISKNVYVKIPINPCIEESCSKNADGIKAIQFLSSKDIPINCTLVFTPEQALLAAKAGAKIVSPFVGREDDYIRDLHKIKFKKEDYFPARGKKKLGKTLSDRGITSGVDLIKECRLIFDKQKIKTEILAASIRNNQQFREVALAGANIATLPFKVIETLLTHHKTAEGMRNFTKDIVPEYASLLK